VMSRRSMNIATQVASRVHHFRAIRASLCEGALQERPVVCSPDHQLH
jgi:hypothetical protein